MFTPREISSIQQSYFAALAEVDSAVNDIAQGSFAYTIARANAAVVASQDIALRDLSNSAYLSRARGSQLDEWAATFRLKRAGASPSTGYVLAISNDKELVFLPSDTILTDLKTGVQVRMDRTGTVEVNDYTEVVIPVRTVRLGSTTRLPAGTELFSPRYPSVAFTVGYTRSVSGEYCGSLEGGTDTESDGDFRRRISDALTTAGSSSETRLKILLEENELVNRAYVNTKVAGIVEIWVDSLNILTQSQLLELEAYINPYTAAGTIVSIGSLQRKYVDVGVFVRPFASADLDRLSDQLASTIKYLFNSLTIGETFSPLVIQSSLAPLARDVRVISPTSEVVPQPYELVSYRAIDLTFSTQS